MRSWLYILFVCLVGNSCAEVDPRPPSAPLTVIPQPVSSILLKDSFLLTGKTLITVADDTDTRDIGIFLQNLLCSGTGYKNEVKQSDDSVHSIHLFLNKIMDPAIGEEGYILNVSAAGILLKANKSAGLFYGVQTLHQLLPNEIKTQSHAGITEWKIPGVQITDHPRFKWRGIMLDVSRHFLPLTDLKKLIDEMAMYKFNILHLHLTDDNGWRIEIKSLPELTHTGAWRVTRTAWWGTREPPSDGEPTNYGGFYTQEELKELLSYAKDRWINIVPEIDMPGHCLAAIASYKNLSCSKANYKVNPGSKFYGTDDNALCAGNDSTYVFAEKVLTEVAALFPYPYIHVGGDECYKGFWNTCPVCRSTMQKEKLKNTDELQAYFFRRLKKILDAMGKKMIGWDEILDGGFNDDVVVMNWRAEAKGARIIEGGHQLIAASEAYTYLDHYQADPVTEKPSFDMLRLKKVYRYEPVPDNVDERLVLGGQANLWGEFVEDRDHAEYMLWPRAFALSEIFWSPKEERNWKDFIRRTKYNLQLLKFSGINYASSFYDAEISVSKNKEGKIVMTLDSELDSLQIYYTFGNKDPDMNSMKYNKGEILVLPDTANFFRAVTYQNGLQAGKIIVLPKYEFERRAAIQ